MVITTSHKTWLNAITNS